VEPYFNSPNTPSWCGVQLKHRDNITSTLPLCFNVYITGMMKSKRMRWARYAARMGQIRDAYTILVEKLEGKRPLGRRRRTWDDSIKVDLK
jgi:hypothetical protein